ncbi:hypothetical protein VSS37_10440 [Candidatus Thiothrix sp. Deng01]|uniref:DUF1353 domain-containing protein n=1 Tax=Candidatus Thiothrix phosphatis TaxID=3112415 RepID=A0ABU6CZ97_9GAMM|nr:hypothetical protein [Candidatus Thiothrix sp. Deng01]MEB4591397.1 hypothetical protein [Candidatus Thiothrix sp. Deng01]
MSDDWKWRLARDYRYETGLAVDCPAGAASLQFGDGKQTWLTIDADGAVTVSAGYAWDGCSPKFKVFNVVLGTPDGAPNPQTGRPYTYFASLVHDALYQFMDAPGFPWTRAQIDAVFLQILRADGWCWAGLYYAAVRYAGGAYRWINQWRMFA